MMCPKCRSMMRQVGEAIIKVVTKRGQVTYVVEHTYECFPGDMKDFQRWETEHAT